MLVRSSVTLICKEVNLVYAQYYFLKSTAPLTLVILLYRLSDTSNFGLYTLYKHDQSQYMRLDATALTALNLFPSSSTSAAKTMSVYGLLDQCKTAQGSRLLGMWLKQPLMQLSAPASSAAGDSLDMQGVEMNSTGTSESAGNNGNNNIGCSTIQGRLDIVDALVKESEIRCKIRDSHLKNVNKFKRMLPTIVSSSLISPSL